MKRKTVKKIIFWTLGSLLSLFIIALILFLKAAPYSPIMPAKFTFNINYSDYGLQAEKFSVKVDDSISISGVFVKSNKDSSLGTIIMLHGIASCKEFNVSRAKIFADSGFNSIRLDMRAHGASGGKFCTFGYYEKNDIKTVIDTALVRFGNIEPLAIMGHSLGGAISIQTMAYDKRIKAACASGVFARLDGIICDYMARITKVLRAKFISDDILEKSALIANFKPFEVNPEESAKQITQPVFMYHGELDDKISPENGKRVFNNLNSSIKEFYLVKYGDHDNIFNKGGDMLVQKEIEFLKKYLR